MSDVSDQYRADFVPVQGHYFLSHSVGRPLKSTKHAFEHAFFEPWETQAGGLWPQWLGVIEDFQAALATLFHAKPAEFCPQVNVSSALTKLVMSLDVLQEDEGVVLVSEADFPTIGFVFQKALPNPDKQLRFIPKTHDLSDANMWADYLTDDVALCLISHVYSNTGQQAPVGDIVPLAKSKNILTVIDAAQSAGIIPLNLGELQPDALIGSSVKWLCGGSGACYLWIHPELLEYCQPKDVGWFSHENPFEFDVHNFRYHPTSLRFWGGTPAIAPYAIASHSISYLADIGTARIREHNTYLINKVLDELQHEVVSPRDVCKRSGTMVLHFGNKHENISQRLTAANIHVDQRELGMRVSPHVYTTSQDIDTLLQTVEDFA
ncbi:MAG: aminotransferase class V-fold PLP-dependent enzyme [Deinococcota bacterium]